MLGFVYLHTYREMGEILNIGDLVADNDPYKAPEQFRGLGIVVEILDTDYVVVHWNNYREATAMNILYLKKVKL